LLPISLAQGQVRREVNVTCFHCGAEIEPQERVGFHDSCAQCERDLHVCLNCAFHDLAYNNQCREPQAERVVDKDRFNFCEYFSPASNLATRSRLPSSEPRAKLAALFKKK
jgi:hypothetical protein